MDDKLILAILGGVFCILGTGFGAFLSLFLKIRTSKVKSALLDFSAGLMLSVVFFGLLPSALDFSNVYIVIIGALIGVFFMIITDSIINSLEKNTYIKAGIVLVIGLSLHNLPEGIAIGSSLNIDRNLFMTLCISIFVHHIPEGILMAIPLKIGGMRRRNIILISVITGVFALFGAIFGTEVEEISLICSLISIASGAMLYVIFFEIIPQSKALYRGRFTSLCVIFGILCGMLL